jgi:RNA polymerase sigma-70 factor (ECF subfamily)
MTPLADVLVLCRAKGAPSASLEAALASALREAEEAWPDLRVGPEAFMAYLAPRLDDDLEASVRAVRAPDLYLACACAAGDAAAIAAFERVCFGEIDDVLAKMGLSAAGADDVKQLLRRRFFVGEEGRAPRILHYAGKGELRRWVRAAAVRAALRVLRQAKRGAVSVDDALLEAVSEPAQDPELDFLKRTYGKAFEAALREAYESLAPREKNLLRYYFGEGLSIDELGVVYRVHRATAARRVQKVNAELAAETRRRLAARLGLSGADVSSVLRLVRSQIERALRGILNARAT